VKQQEERSNVLMDRLVDLAEARQATVNETTFAVYAKALATYDLGDIDIALNELALQPREDYKPAFPELGVVIVRIEKAESVRRKKARGKYESCGGCLNGTLFLNAQGQRYDPEKDSERFATDCECKIAWRARG
jgi:DNA-directed RNA polymerase subunit M/transcription elongation factor TFIIS